MHSLPLFHRVAGKRVVVIGDGDMAAAKRRLVERAGGTCVGEEQWEDCKLAFVAVEDGADFVTARLKARGLLVNVADRPDLCDFTLPSVLERDDVLIAVSTGGASAGLAKQLRLRLETILPASLGALARALSSAREAMRERWPSPDDRRMALDEALREGSTLDPFDARSTDRVEQWVSSRAPSSARKVEEFVLTSDDPDDLTLRQARALGTADIVRHESAVSPAILARARADAVRRPIDAPGEDEGQRRVVILRRRIDKT